MIWTPTAALAFIEARPGDGDADAIIGSLARQLQDREQCLDEIEKALYGGLYGASREDLLIEIKAFRAALAGATAFKTVEALNRARVLLGRHGEAG